MTDLLVKLFIKDYKNVKDGKVRKQYGFCSGIVGIFCNVLLFGLKLTMGLLSGSVSIVSDAMNNLSDAGNCVISLLGYKLAAKPADKNHPFGHGRMEYLFSLIVASLILMVGVELLKTSVTKILHPDVIHFSWVVLGALILSILMKFWMFLFNRNLGKRIDSSVMIATSKDSLTDVIATTATVIALVASLFTTLPVDGVMGCVVSCFILLAGIGIIRDTVAELLGQPADRETVEALIGIVMADPHVSGVHDIMIHSYGPGNSFGSLHAEVDGHGDMMEIHDAIDVLEYLVYEQTGVILTIHMDPILKDIPQYEELRELIRDTLHGIDEYLSFHDFRVVPGPTHTNVLFDVVLPFDAKVTQEHVQTTIEAALDARPETKYFAVVKYDRGYTE